jgi:hypothetical protein
MVENWKIIFGHELELAETARQSGNEGRARVCARRAVGIVLNEYYLRNGFDEHTSSSYELIKSSINNQEIPFDIREVLEHFVYRVSEEFTLPQDIDLVKEAEWIGERLL